jgi:hypothetical protein
MFVVATGENVVGYLFFSLLFQFLVRAMLCAGGRNC